MSSESNRLRAAVLMPTYQGMEFLARVLDALRAQRTPFEWEMVVIDSSSNDGTWEFLERARDDFPVPLKLERIHGVEFDHGDTRNLLACRTGAEILVFVTQDAIPASPDWLATLVANFDGSDEVGAAYCRNVPRPDARTLTKIFSEGDPGYQEGRREVRLPEPDVYAELDPHQRRLLYNFNDVASAFRRDLWERHPFPRTPFGEDVLMARAFLEAGYTVVYDDAASVEHSHDYDADETRKRTRIDGEFSAEWLDRICVASASDARALTELLSKQDGARLDELAPELGLAAPEVEVLRAEGRELRAAMFDGLYEGGRTSNRRPSTRMRASGRLELLYVVHGFPPDTWAGTEIYTLGIAREMLRRGHGVTVLTRAPAAGDEPDFTLREEEFEGLRVLRMTHRLDHAGLRESFSKSGPEQVFSRVLDQVRPDVVHFQHLIHTSIGLVDIARRRGLGTVVTCHDYWALCSRVQMIRPDGSICPSNMGSGCYLCVKERGLAHVERVAKLDQIGGGRVLEALAGFLGDEEAAGKLARKASDYTVLRERERDVVEAYAAADLRISPSRFLREKYLESGAFDPHTFLFSDNGMRTDHVEALEKTPDPEGRVRFGFIGSVVWYKGVGTLVEAAAKLAARGFGDRFQVHVHGGFDPETDAHHAEVAATARGAPVSFHGRFDNSRLSEVYRDIDVLVVPSVWYENSPITIHEAFLVETPVVASDIGGMVEFVRDGVDGLRFAVGDAEDLADKLQSLIEDRALLERLQSADWIPIKTLDENGAETEARYRALACVERTVDVSTVGGRHDVAVLAPDASSEGAEFQAPDSMLLRQGASVEYALPSLGAGVYEAELEVLHFEGEDATDLGGTLSLREDSGPARRLAVFESAPRPSDAYRAVRTARFELDAGGGELTLILAGDDPTSGGKSILRFTRLALVHSGATLPNASGGPVSSPTRPEDAAPSEAEC
ncbi:MAG: glycosyltransferase [Planctomycetota bacterium]